jgi:hypothetical protein
MNYIHKMLIEEFVTNNTELIIKNPLQNVYMYDGMYNIDFDMSQYPKIKYKVNYIISKKIDCLL